MICRIGIYRRKSRGLACISTTENIVVMRIFWSLQNPCLGWHAFHLAVSNVQVVEATTANGLCTIQVRALPLPAKLASILDNHEDLLRRTFASERDELAASNALQHDISAATQQHDSSAALEQAPAASLAPVESNGHGSSAPELHSTAGTSDEPQLSSLTLEDKAPDSASESASKAVGYGNSANPAGLVQSEQQHASSMGAAQHDAAQRGKSADIGQLQSRLHAAAKEAGTAVEDLLQRAWMLGPRRVRSMKLVAHDDVLLPVEQFAQQSPHLHQCW